jgi:hypothetical protein
MRASIDQQGTLVMEREAADAPPQISPELEPAL